jgi:4-hydroxy-tetrahydrodipicolinate synthase
VLGEVLTAVVTPFKGDGSVDLDGFRALCRHLVENGSDGVVVTGTTGEAPTLTDEERFALYEAAVAELGGAHTVIAGTGTYSTAHSVHLTEQAHAIGVDGMLIVTPYYNRPPQRGIVAHVQAVAAATDRPIVFYDIPSRVVVDAEPATITALGKIENVRAVKQAKPSLDAARHVVACGLDLYAGDDDLLFSFLEVGGVGGICVHTHVVGPQVQELIRLYRSGDIEGAREIDQALRPAIEILRVQTNPIAIKTALNLLGHEVGGLRLPLVGPTAEETAAVRDCLERLGLLQPVAA